jgi:hypothetical protein
MTRPASRLDDRRSTSGPAGGAVLAVAAAVLMVFVGAVVVLASGPDPDRHRPATGGIATDDTPALDLTSIADSIAVHYFAAEADPVTYRDVPCFCGCEEFLGHRHLYDCYVRADDRGWDAHAAGCGICIAESVTVQELLDEGHDIPTIRDAVIAQYGATTPTSSPPATPRS